MSAQVEVDHLRLVGQPGEVRFEVGVVVGERTAVHQHHGRTPAHPAAVRDEERAVDVEPEPRPVYPTSTLPTMTGGRAESQTKLSRCIMAVQVPGPRAAWVYESTVRVSRPIRRRAQCESAPRQPARPANVSQLQRYLDEYRVGSAPGGGGGGVVVAVGVSRPRWHAAGRGCTSGLAWR